MSKRDGNSPETAIRAGLRGIMLLIVILVLAGVFQGRLAPAARVSIPGIAVMLVGLALVIAANILAGRLPEARRKGASALIKLGGVFICVAGAMMVFYL